jgi:uncharacterized DUF497 family protein
MPPWVSELLVTFAAIDKLGARGISVAEVLEVPWNDPTMIRKRAHTTNRRLLLGRTNGGRYLTLVIEETAESTTWLVITGWDSSERERKISDGH